MIQIKLGYWKVRGRAQISRLLLTYSQLDWVDVQYQKKEEWFNKDKQQLQLAFPNLPYLIHGDLKITESHTIQNYIVNISKHKSELLGDNLQRQAMIQNFIDVLQDIRQAIVVRALWGLKKEEFQEKKDNCFQQVKVKMEKVAQFVDKNDFVFGKLTLADFFVQELSYYIEAIYPAQYKKYPFLQRIRSNFNALPKIKAYYQREDAIEKPFIAGESNLNF